MLYGVYVNSPLQYPKRSPELSVEYRYITFEIAFETGMYLAVCGYYV